MPQNEMYDNIMVQYLLMNILKHHGVQIFMYDIITNRFNIAIKKKISSEIACCY